LLLRSIDKKVVGVFVRFRAPFTVTVISFFYWPPRIR
jgi:hypothetical protein